MMNSGCDICDICDIGTYIWDIHFGIPKVQLQGV